MCPQRDLYVNVHRTFTYKIAYNWKQPSINEQEWIKQTVVYLYKEILLSN